MVPILFFLFPIFTNCNFAVNSTERIVEALPIISVNGAPFNITIEENRTVSYFKQEDTKFLVFVCKSNMPHRWLWTPYSKLENRRMSVEIDNEIKEADGITEHFSRLIVRFNNFQDKMQVNFTCVNSVLHSHPHIGTCVNFFFNKPRSSHIAPLGLSVVEGERLDDCVAIFDRNDRFPHCPVNTSRVDLSHSNVKGVCKMGGWPMWGLCVDLELCDPTSFTNSSYKGCGDDEATMTNIYNKGYLWHRLGFPKVEYCRLQLGHFAKWPVALIQFPGIKERSFVNGKLNQALKFNDKILSTTLHKDLIQLITFPQEDLQKIREMDLITGRNEFAENEMVEFVCMSSRYLHMSRFSFSIRTEESVRVIVKDLRPTKNQTMPFHTFRKNITMTADYGKLSWISCTGKFPHQSLWISSSMKFTIYPAESPNANLKIARNNDLIVLNCTFRGWPRPTVTWNFSDEIEILNGSEIMPPRDNHNLAWYQIKEVKALRTILNDSLLTANCIAKNFRGSNSATINLKDFLTNEEAEKQTITSLPSLAGWDIMFLWLGIPVVCIITTLIYIRRQYVQKQNPEKVLTKKKSSNSSNNPPLKLERTASHNLYNQSYPKAYELLKNEFSIDENSSLGSGAFGKVCRGKVRKCGEEEWRDVAVKMAIGHASANNYNGLLDELENLPCLGKHPYVVEFIGGYTAELDKNVVYVFLELCELGSLFDYLGNYNVVVEFSMAGVGGYSSTTTSVGESTAEDMCRWSAEIASGMEYIISKGFLHRDLATRNILLTADRRIKISDFGIARPMNESQIYVKKHDNLLPWKWMAPECLPLPGRNIFTEKSDVWSFGVTLWEIFSLGKEPYPDIVNFSAKFAAWLEDGNHLSEPQYCRNNMYSVMLRCWSKEPEERPTFSELIRILRQNSGNSRNCLDST